MALIGDIIAFSDWNALHDEVAEILGPIPFNANTGLYSPVGQGYGFTEDQLTSRRYPFSRPVTNISQTNPATITFSAKHNLVVGEILYLDQFSDPTWALTDLDGTYVRVGSIVDEFRVTIDFSTIGYPAFAGSVECTQPLIGANQFKNLRTDLAIIYQHINGSAPNQTALPSPTRNDVVRYNVYQPYFNEVSDLSTRKLQLGESGIYDYSAIAGLRSTSSWSGTRSCQFRVTFNSQFDFVQYFNTGGFIVLKWPVQGNTGNTAGNNVANLNAEWTQTINRIFPLYYGGFGNDTLGYSDSRSYSTQGAFQATGTYQTIKISQGDTSPYTSDTLTVRHKLEEDQRVIEFEIVVNNVHSNSYAQSVTIDLIIDVSLEFSTGSVPLATSPTGANRPVITVVKSWS